MLGRCEPCLYDTEMKALYVCSAVILEVDSQPVDTNIKAAAAALI